MLARSYTRARVLDEPRTPQSEVFRRLLTPIFVIFLTKIWPKMPNFPQTLQSTKKVAKSRFWASPGAPRSTPVGAPRVPWARESAPGLRAPHARIFAFNVTSPGRVGTKVAKSAQKCPPGAPPSREAQNRGFGPGRGCSMEIIELAGTWRLRSVGRLPDGAPPEVKHWHEARVPTIAYMVPRAAWPRRIHPAASVSRAPSRRRAPAPVCPCARRRTVSRGASDREDREDR